MSTNSIKQAQALSLGIKNLKENNCPTINFQSDIHNAAFNGDLKMLQETISQKPQLINAKDADGNNALIPALLGGSSEVVLYLAKYGCEINHSNKLGQTPLHFASMIGEENLLKIILEYNGIESILNKDDFGRTPLHYGSLSELTDSVEYLTAAGGDPNAVDEQGFTPIHYAAFSGHRITCQTLVNQGAELEKNVDCYQSLLEEHAAESIFSDTTSTHHDDYFQLGDNSTDSAPLKLSDVLNQSETPLFSSESPKTTTFSVQESESSELVEGAFPCMVDFDTDTPPSDF